MGETSTKTLTITNNDSKDLIFNIQTDFSTKGSSHNYAIQFDGLDDYVSIQSAPLLETDEITIEAWIKIY